MAQKAQSIYVISEQGLNDRVKIGIAVHPPKRMRTLQTGNPNKLYIVAAYTPRNARRIETLAHEVLAQHRGEGEWFTVEPTRAVDTVRQLIARFG